MTQRTASITGLIGRFRDGDKEAQEKLFDTVYFGLKNIARRQMRGIPHTLTPTSLVHEAFISLSRQKSMDIQDTKHFFLVAARCMRWILMDYAKAKRRKKRSGQLTLSSFDEKFQGAQWTEAELVALNDALTQLTKKDERLSRIVELRFLVGLGIEETARVLDISTGTVKRDWQLARAWLRKELSGSQE